MRYTKEQGEYVREIAFGRYNSEIAALFNTKFGTNITAEEIRNYKSNHKIRSNVPTNKKGLSRGLFTEEQKDFIRANAANRSNKELTDLINKTFGSTFITSQVKAWKNRNHIDSGLNGYFEKGHVPINKGTKGMFNVGGNSGSFKKGETPLNYKPVGSERIDRDGYCLVKVQDHGTWPERWRHKHKVIWEKENGPIPAGHVLMFSDGNKENIRLDNLLLITQNQLLQMNRNGWIGEEREITETGLLLADLVSRLSEKKRSRKKKIGGKVNEE